MRREIAGRGHYGGALLTRNPHGRHVALEELAEMNAGIITAGHEVAPRVVFAGEVEHEVGVGAGERREPGTQQGRQDNRRRDQPDDAGRRLTELAHVQQRRAAAAISIHGARYPEALERLSNRSAADP
jgi:hypothetical protein